VHAVANFSWSIPHNLTRDEAKRRLQGGFAQIGRGFGSLLTGVTQEWTGDTLNFSVSAAGQTVTGRAIVEDHAVHIEATLPWMLAMLAGQLKSRIDQRAREALEDKSSRSMASPNE
jgi:hypothetical protein